MQKFSELKYDRPDFRQCRRDLGAVAKALKRAGTYEDFRKAYIDMEDVIIRIYNSSTICHIRNTIDTTDKFYEAEQEAISKGSASIAMAQQKCAKAFVASKFRAEFDAEFGPHLSRTIETELRLINPLVLPGMIKEDKLGRIYSKDAAACKTDFRGEECNFYGLLKHMESTDRDERREAFHAWAGLYESISGKLDATYDRLVKLRVSQARKLGFKSYIDYIYLARGRYDYSPEDAARFRAQVRDIIVPVCSRLYEAQAKRLGVDKLHWYDEALVFPEGNAVPEGTKDELVEKALSMYKELSPETGDFFTFMTDYELFDLETRPGKHLGGYCTFMPIYKAPFIFSNFNGTSADVDVLTHEAGHAFQAYTASRALSLANQISSISEINEIHSMSMEHFTYPWMESFFPGNSRKYRYAHLVNSICSIPYLVCVDEFQHRVFENPSMTALERRKVWREIEKTYLPWRDYDGNEFLEQGGFWMQKQHIFLYPFYYIDYALAQICAYQFFLKDRDNHEKAWADYLGLCRRGGSMGYFDLLKSADLLNPFDEGTVEKVIGGITEIIREFEP